MAEKSFRLEIVTPRKVVFSGDVASFSAPGVLGAFQVLCNHAPMIAAIGIGEVRIRDAEGNQHYYATSGGFVEVLKNHVTALVETAERADEIDVQRAEASKNRAAQRLDHPDPDVVQERARLAFRRASNRLRIAGR